MEKRLKEQVSKTHGFNKNTGLTNNFLKEKMEKLKKEVGQKWKNAKKEVS